MYLCMYIYGELYIECSILSGHLRMYIGWILLLYRGKASLAFLVYLFVGGGQRRARAHAAAGTWSLEDNPWELVLSFYHAGPGDQIQFAGLGSKCLS